jgi:predicted HD phosphohydrolase
MNDSQPVDERQNRAARGTEHPAYARPMADATRRATPSEAIDLLGQSAGTFDADEPVDNLAHALQCAQLALAEGAHDELVVAALFHDVGYHPRLIARWADLPHEHVGARFAEEVFGERVAWLIAQHVPAKRYLVATDPGYTGRLSQASKRSLDRQGGPMTAAEVQAFADHPWANDAANLRRWDDLAKVPGAPIPTLDQLRPIVERVAASASGLQQAFQ